MSEFNKNNPTELWSEEEQYIFSKIENTWVKDLVRFSNARRTSGRVSDITSDPTFTSIEEINAAFKKDIGKRATRWRYLCLACDFGTDDKTSYARHLMVHTDERTLKCSQCESSFKRKLGVGKLVF